MRRILFASIGAIAFLILSIILSVHYLNVSRDRLFVFPNSEIDENGTNAYAWRGINEKIGIDLYWGKNSKVIFYTTTSSLQEVEEYFNHALDGKIVMNNYFDDLGATQIGWSNYRDSMILTYAPTDKEGVHSLVIERLWPIAWWKYLFGF